MEIIVNKLPEAPHLWRRLYCIIALHRYRISVVFGDLVFRMACIVSDLPHILGHRDVDRVICDVPFGVNHSCVSDVKELYPRLIRAMDRCVSHHS